MHYFVISFNETSTVREVSQKAKDKGISQFPVLRNGIIVGSISTNAILGAGKNEREESYRKEVTAAKDNAEQLFWLSCMK